ncbi:MAG: TonB-dependent receptor [Asticcacaulis sp.]|uniref:TonB-dependent receptor n=1 Tax=Asticcacaulis sp. TaxID=1872648 RepID=UPI0039E33BE5
MAMSKRLMYAGSLLVLSTVFAGQVCAEEAAKAPESGPQEIIITAQKTRTVASKTPIALSVFSGDTLKEQGVVNVTNLQNIAPSLSVGSASHGVNIAIRGVATTDVTSKGDQGIVFSLDGAPVGRPQEMGLSFFDIERVEVLRGPQGTLYGKSSTGGAINVITNKPKNVFDASASFEVGNFNTRRGEAMINLPITDNFAIRAAGAFNKRDGYLEETLGNTQTLGKPISLDDEDNATGRISALWKYSDNGSLLVTGTFGHVGGTGLGAALYDSVLNKSGKDARQVYYNPYGASMDDDFQNLTAELNQDFGAVHLTYIGAHLKFSAHDTYAPSTNNPDGNGGYYNWTNYLSDVTTDSHELRLQNAQPQRLEWVIGANYYKEYNMEHDQNWSSAVSCSPSLDASCNTPNPGILGPTTHKGTGIFGQINYHATDKLKLTLGLRESSDSLTRVATIAAGPGPFYDASGNLCAPPNDCVASANNNAFIANDNGSQSASKMTWRVGADYQMTPSQMIYASVATGYKAGGFNDYDPATQSTAPYDPEELTAYEVGYKGRPTSNLQFNSSLYYYDYAKYGVTAATSFGVGPTGPIVFIYTKSAPLTLYGWENEATWRVTPNDTIGGSLAFEHGKFGDLSVGFVKDVPIDWTGKTPDNTPEVSGTAYYEHKWTMGDGAIYNFRIGTKYSSSYFVSDLGGQGNPFCIFIPNYTVSDCYSVLPQQYEQKAYTRTDLNLSYTSPNGKYVISAYVRNLEDKLQFASAPQTVSNNTASGAVSVRVSAPRTFGLRVGMNY